MRFTTEYLYEVTAKHDNPDDAAAAFLNIVNTHIEAQEAKLAELEAERHQSISRLARLGTQLEEAGYWHDTDNARSRREARAVTIAEGRETPDADS